MTRDKYIDKYSKYAVDSSIGTGLYPSVMLAQAIVESNNGNSELASKYNNHFGIKANSSWHGKKVNMNTREVINGDAVIQGDYFRVYPSAKASYEDRIKFLLENPRYKLGGVFTAKTPFEQLERLESSGYATDPQYAEILNQVLETENLGVLDKAMRYVKNNPIPSLLMVIGMMGLILIIKK